MNSHNTIIIGAGPAGIAAAIQLKRAGIDVAVIEKGEIGGLLLNANLIENYPGLEKPVSGIELVERFKKQLLINTVSDNVINVEQRENNFEITGSDSNYKCNNLIIASGTKPKHLNIDIDFPADKIFYEAYPIRDIKDKTIAIIGGGDAAFDYALNLAKRNTIKIYFRSEKPKCLPLLYERASKNEKITIIPNAVHCFAALAMSDYLLIAVGREPNIDFLSINIRNDFLEKKKTKGLYFAGDVINGDFRQTAIAVGDGVKAAMQLIKGDSCFHRNDRNFLDN